MPHSKPGITLALLLGIVFVLGGSWAVAAAPEVVSVKKIWDQGKHNAFTDLIRWRGQWYCTFREADDHVGGDGKLRVLVSKDGESWESAALIAEEGIDLRDPKLSITLDDRLMIVAGGSVYEGKTLLGRQPRVAFSKDGRTWTEPQRALSDGEWLWRVTWHDGKAYGVSYNAAQRASDAAKKAAATGKVEPGPAEWKLKGLTLRWFFKEALRGFLPDAIIGKQKHGFGLPFGVWLQEHKTLQQLAADSLSDLKQRKVVRGEFIEQLVGQHLQEHAGYHGTMVWVLMMLEQWFRQHRTT